VIPYLKERKARMLMISATMCYNVKGVRELVNQVRSDAQLNEVKIVVGGYPFNQSSRLWRSVGADGFARDAVEAVQVANQLGRPK
jgi:methanogenic corrinoid protein MtbC1